MNVVPEARSGVVIMLGWIGAMLACTSALIILLWLVGRVLTDRWFWSQWLFWIPTPALMPVIVLGLIASLRPGREPRVKRNRLIRWAACGFVLLVYFSMIEHRLLHRTANITTARDTPGQLRLVHWNAQDVSAKPEAVLDRLRELDGDVMFLTDINWNLWVPLSENDPLQTGIKPAHFGALAVVSRLPIVSFRPLVASKDLIYIALAEIDGTDLIGRVLRVYFVDLPSDPMIPRADLMRRARVLLEQAAAPGSPPAADVVVGDFNIPRGSASINLLFPGLREAFDDAGHGYGATYPRNLPLYHIDHMLLNDDLRVIRYDLVKPGLGRHWAQIGWITVSQ